MNTPRLASRSCVIPRLVVSVATALVVILSPESATADDAALRQRFLTEAPAAWKQLARMVEQVDVVGVVRDGLEGAHPRPEAKSGFRFKANGQAKVVLADRRQGDELVVCVSPKYGFRLKKAKDAKTGPYVVSYFGNPKKLVSDDGDDDLSLYGGHYVETSTRFGSVFGGLLNKPGFHVKDVSPIRRDDRDLVRVEFEYKPEKPSGDILDSLKGGWVLLDPDQSWRLQESEFTAVGYRTTATIEYGPKIDGIPTLRRIKNDTYGDEPRGGHSWDICDFTSWERRDVPDREFTLSAFDLPEMSYSPPTAAPTWGPWIWISLGLVSGLIGLGLWLLRTSR